MKLYSHITQWLIYVSCFWIIAGYSQRQESSDPAGPAEHSLSFVEEVVIKEKELASGDFLTLPNLPAVSVAQHSAFIFDDLP